MILSTTGIPMTGFLKPAEKGQFVIKPTLRFQSLSRLVHENTTIISHSSSDIKTAVLSQPMSQTTPMAILASPPSSSPVVDRTFEEPRYYGYVMIPVVFMFVLAVISGIVLYCMQRRKKLDTLRHHLIPVYNFAPGEEEEWGVLLDADNDPKRPHLHGP